MKNSWLFKLLGAFLLVVAVGGLVISVLTSKATQSAFTLYTTRSGKIWAERLAPVLAEFYSQNNNWQGVDVVIQENYGVRGSTNGSGNGMMGQGHGMAGNGQFSGQEMMGALGQRFILTDDQGTVVFDSLNQLVNTELTPSEMNKGTAVLVNEMQVGTILITPGDYSGADNLATEFFSSVKQAIISSALIASVIAVLLGTLLFIQITAPMRKLRKAAAAISNGDLDQRVDIKGKDEFAELGSTFNQMAENLSLAEIQRQHLMADVAHELRTPLTAIQGTLEAMQDGVLPIDKEQMDALYSETLLLNRLIGDLRLLSLAEASQLKLELVETEPAKLVQQVVDRAQPQARLKNIHLETKLQPNLPKLMLDPDRITQVLNNLINNSLRYTPQDGTILVEAAQQNSLSQLVITISDTGPGITPEDLPFVFDRFYRVDKSRSRARCRSGLG
jgi:signal transduction histidine kinase